MLTRAVEKPVFVDGKKVEGFKAICRESDGYVYAIVSTNYALIQHQDLLNIVNKVMTEIFENPKIEYEEYNNGARLFIKVLLPSKIVQIRDNDAIIPAFYIQNSYDKSTGIKIIGGFYRVLCKNLAAFHKEFELRTSKRHIGKDLPERVKWSIEEMATSIFRSIELLKASAEKKLSLVRAAQIIDAVKIPEKCKDYIIEKLLEIKKLTLWDVFNYGTEYITHKSNASIDRKISMLQELSRIILLANSEPNTQTNSRNQT